MGKRSQCLDPCGSHPSKSKRWARGFPWYRWKRPPEGIVGEVSQRYRISAGVRPWRDRLMRCHAGPNFPYKLSSLESSPADQALAAKHRLCTQKLAQVINFNPKDSQMDLAIHWRCNKGKTNPSLFIACGMSEGHRAAWSIRQSSNPLLPLGIAAPRDAHAGGHP